MWSVILRGLSFITKGLGGKEAKDIAAKVSMMRFTQSIWVTVSGDWVSRNAPNITITQAITLIVNWNRMKRCTF